MAPTFTELPGLSGHLGVSDLLSPLPSPLPATTAVLSYALTFQSPATSLQSRLHSGRLSWVEEKDWSSHQCENRLDHTTP